MTFSERQGYKPIRQSLQIGRMDDALRNRLWNATFQTFLSDWAFNYPWDGTPKTWATLIWGSFYKLQITQIPHHRRDALDDIVRHFSGSPWYVVYDYIEFFVRHAGISGSAAKALYNGRVETVLREELSGYRLIAGQIVQLTGEDEITSIAACEELGGKFASVSEHIKEAVKKFADRKTPDYRNSIKESISAVEAICRIVTGKDSLAGALDVLPKRGIIVHKAIHDAFKKLYGYTSDAEGIRHALLDQTSLDQEDAKFMLVTCSAFVNLVRAREAENNK